MYGTRLDLFLANRRLTRRIRFWLYHPIEALRWAILIRLNLARLRRESAAYQRFLDGISKSGGPGAI